MNQPVSFSIEIKPGQPVHATAVVIAERGFLFFGPSGSGKTQAALSCLADACRRGQFAALVADDRVMLEIVSGRVVARCPQPISGKAEIRGSGIFDFDSRASAVISCLIAPGQATGAQRIPDQDEQYTLQTVCLPVLRMDYKSVLRPYEILVSAGRLADRELNPSLLA